MDFLTHARIISAVNSTPQEIGDNLRRIEIEQGFTLVDEAIWLDKSRWDDKIIISMDGKRVRLVALKAKRSFEGAFSALIYAIWKAGLTPVLVEPNAFVANWAAHHNFRERRIGGKYPHTIWHPRK